MAKRFDYTQAQEIGRIFKKHKIREGPFDLDLIFAPDGLEPFEEACQRSLEIEGLPVCHIDDIIRSKEATGRIKDKESLPRLKAFRDWWAKNK